MNTSNIIKIAVKSLDQASTGFFYEGVLVLL